MVGTNRALLEQIRRYIIIEPSGCHRWTRAMSQSGRRGVFYPVLWVMGATRRVNRLVLMIKTLPQGYGETGAAWLNRAIATYREQEASHTCDHSYCVNGDHLIWESHPENVQQQAKRRHQQQQKAVA